VQRHRGHPQALGHLAQRQAVTEKRASSPDVHHTRRPTEAHSVATRTLQTGLRARDDRLAFATARGVEVLALDTHEVRMLTPLGGVDRLRWTDAGLVARAGNAVDLVGDDGHRRTLLEVRPGAAVAAAKGRVVTFAPSAMRELDVARADSRPTVTKLDDPGAAGPRGARERRAPPGHRAS